MQSTLALDLATVKRALEHADDHLAAATEDNPFAAKLRLASTVSCKCEEFNVWHAAADNVTEGGVDAAWGSTAKRIA
jgi:hypothetical protein